MSDMKCPFCGLKLVRHWGMEEPALYCCDNPKCSRGGVATESAWQELIRIQELFEIEDAEHSMCHTQMLKTTEKLERTRKALDVAVDKLKGIKAFYDDSYADPHFVNWHIVAQRLANDADDAIKAITALEQKENNNE